MAGVAPVLRESVPGRRSAAPVRERSLTERELSRGKSGLRGRAPARTTRVFAVDGRPLVRSGLAGIARRAVDGGALALTDLNQASAARCLTESDPEALLLGLRTGDDPAALVADARRIAPIVICVVDRADPAFVRSALDAEADGYLLSERADAESLHSLIDAIRFGGETIPADLLGRASGGTGGGNQVGPGFVTERCREVLLSLADGLHDDEIAERLGISTSSVRKHVANAQERLEAKTRTQAVARAARAGLL
jgi:DNA-binding NarL/FixJ family response regulator